MFNEKDFPTRLPKGSPRLVSQIKFLFKILLLPKEKLANNLSPKFFMNKISYSLGLAVILLAVVGVYAYSSPTVTTGDALFSVKQLGEKVAVFSTSQTDKSEVWAQIADRRLAEFNYLTGGTNDIKLTLIKSAQAAEEDSLSGSEKKTAQTLSLMKTAFDNSLSMTAKINNPEKLEKATAHLEKIQIKQKALLEAVLNNSLKKELLTKDEIAKKVDSKILTPEMAEKIAVAIDESDTRGEAIKKIKEEIKTATLEKRKIQKEKIASSSDFIKKSDLKAVDVQLELDKSREDVAAWKAALSEKISTSSSQVKKLFERLDDRLLKAEQALKDGKLEASWSLLKSVQALENQGNHFVSEKSVKDEMQKARQNIKINRIFSDEAREALREKTTSLKMERLERLDQSIQLGDMASSTRQILREKIKSYQEQVKPQPKQIRRLFKNIPLPSSGPEIKVVPNTKQP